MDKCPIRRKFKDNPYKLESMEENQIYIINFMDIKGETHSIRVSKEVFDVFDEDLINKMTIKELKKLINNLPEIQKRRIKKYYFEDKNVYEIAEEEHTSHQAISKSLNNALKKLKEILKN